MPNLFDGNYGESPVDNLFYDTTHPKDVKSVVLKAGQGILLRGTVLGLATADGLASVVNSTKTDGTELADSILTDNVDTGVAGATENVVMTAYSSGSFNRLALIFGGTDTADKHETRLRSLGIFIKDTHPYE